MARLQPGRVAGMPPREERERAADEAAQERADAAAHDIGSVAPGFVHAVHPDHGEPVTFVPGELLPRWVVELWRSQPEPVTADPRGVYRLRQPEAQAPTRRKGARR